MVGDKRGIAMLIVISLILMLLILGGGALIISIGHFGTSYHQIRRAQAYYAAEAAMQHALWRCRDGQYNLESASFPISDNPPNDINGISSSDIDIEILDKNQLGQPPDVYAIHITVTY